MKKDFEAWIQFYMEFADKLRHADRKVLIERIKGVYASIGMRLPKLERDDEVIDIDPFTIFGLFNKGISNVNRIHILSGFAREFGVTAPVPQSFDGIPVMNNQAATFYYFIGDRGERDIDNLWELFHAALDYADDAGEGNRRRFVEAYDAVLAQRGIKWNMTIGLFWIRPYVYLNLDSRNRWFILDDKNMPSEFVNSLNKLIAPPDGEEYLELIARCKAILTSGAYPYDSFPALSCCAWQTSEAVNRQMRLGQGGDVAKVQEEAPVDALASSEDAVRYWLYAPGQGSAMWEKFYSQNEMGIGWAEIGDLRAFSTKEEMKQRMKEAYDPTCSYMNAAHATWQFANEMKAGDIIFVKRGRNLIIGRGVVAGDYVYRQSDSQYPHRRSVKWTHKGEWPHPDGQAAMKTLTDITPYTEYVEKLCGLFDGEGEADAEEKSVPCPEYTATDFLSQVYMQSEAYDTLVGLLRTKKNVILQGAPGVGKTFAAKRLAYSMMGAMDPNRVMMVQFHQSYSYEDFIEGYRPAANGFVLNKGAFYKFCKAAETDDENEYFFIIDEINRGNLSRIFGELFMLIESDKRGVQLQLLYSGERFAVPKNVYIIGMMNTADRSLAMLDYALRRRFAFYEMRPGFDTDGFRAYRMSLGSEKFDRLIHCVEGLNGAIAADASLGEGFCVGHSYFCNLTAEKATDRALSAILEYELIPLLREYWFDEPLKVKEWTNNLREALK